MRMTVMIPSSFERYTSLEQMNDQDNFISIIYHQEDKLGIVREGDYGEGGRRLIWISY